MRAKLPDAEKAKKTDSASAPQTVRFKRKLLMVIEKDAEQNYRTVSKQINLLICKAYGFDPKDYI